MFILNNKKFNKVLIFTESKDDFGNFFTKRVKLPPLKYATDTDALQDLCLEKNKKLKKDPKKKQAEFMNNMGLIETVSTDFNSQK